jgi:hypothetical protein
VRSQLVSFPCFLVRSKATHRGSDQRGRSVKASPSHSKPRKDGVMWPSLRCKLLRTMLCARPDRLHLHCTSLLPAKLVAPDKVAANVTAWLDLGAGGSCPLQVGYPAEHQTSHALFRRALPCLGTASTRNRCGQRAMAVETPRPDKNHDLTPCDSLPRSGDDDLTVICAGCSGPACPLKLPPNSAFVCRN